MEPITPQTPNTTGSQDSSIDPQAVNLAKAIRQTESEGNFTAQGKSGEYGAYQWEPATWTAQSSSAGVNVPLDKATPEQQNQVAYSEIKKLKSQGLNPAQIASEWNSGDPNAYTGEFSNGSPSTGTNKQGVAYNVPQYVDKVTSTYQQLKGQTQPTDQAQTASTPSTNTSGNQSPWLTALEGLGIGATGWIASQGGNYLKNAIPDVATDALIGGAGGTAVEPGGGTVLGALGGAGTGLIQAGIQTALQDATGGNQTTQSATPTDTSTQQAQATPDLGSALPQSAIATSEVQNAINESLQSTQTGRVFSQTPQGQEAIQTAAQFGLINPDEEGNLQFNEQKLKQAQAEIGNAQDALIKANGGTASPVSVLNYGGSYIGRDRTATATDKQKASEIMRNEMIADAKGVSTNGQMSLEDMRTAQKTHYTAAQNAYKKGNYSVTPEMLAHKALGNAYGRTIRDNMKDPELYDRTKKMEQNLINTKQVGKKLNGKKAIKNKGVWESFLKQGARAAEIYIGDRLGGPVGAIIGGLAGEHLNRKIEKKFGRNIFETPSMKAALDILQNAKPKEYTELVAALKKNGINFEETDTAPETEEGKVKDVQKDEKIMGQKGLISLSRS